MRSMILERYRPLRVCQTMMCTLPSDCLGGLLRVPQNSTKVLPLELPTKEERWLSKDSTSLSTTSVGSMIQGREGENRSPEISLPSLCL